MNLNLPMPPERCEPALYEYLCRLARELNLALSGLEDAPAPSVSAPSAVQLGEHARSLGALKQLLLNTIALVREGLESLQTELRGDYPTSGLVRTLADTAQARLDAADALLRQLLDGAAAWPAFYEALETRLPALTDAVSEARTDAADAQTQSALTADSLAVLSARLPEFFRVGAVEDAAEGEEPELGLAVGRQLCETGETVTGSDGKAYPVLDGQGALAFLTPDRIRLRAGGREAASLTDGGLVLSDLTAEGGLTLGGWQIDPDGGLSVRWRG